MQQITFVSFLDWGGGIKKVTAVRRKDREHHLMSPSGKLASLKAGNFRLTVSWFFIVSALCKHSNSIYRRILLKFLCIVWGLGCDVVLCYIVRYFVFQLFPTVFFHFNVAWNSILLCLIYSLVHGVLLATLTVINRGFTMVCRGLKWIVLNFDFLQDSILGSSFLLRSVFWLVDSAESIVHVNWR